MVPGGSNCEESACNAGDPDSIPGQEENGVPPPVFLLGEFQGQETGRIHSLGLQRVRLDWMTFISKCCFTNIYISVLYIYIINHIYISIYIYIERVRERERERKRDPDSIPGLRREWLPTPIFLLGECQRQRRLVGNNLWACKELATTERLSTAQPTHIQI